MLFDLLLTFEHFVEDRDQLLSDSETEDQLGANHQDLGSQTLKETSETFILDKILDDLETGFWVFKVTVFGYES